MQASETTELGEALAFGSALLFASVFGKSLFSTLILSEHTPVQVMLNCSSIFPFIYPASNINSTYIYEGIRLAATRKIMPAGPLLALSLFAVALFISAYLQEAV